jgi:hypothetical protein
MKVCDIPVAKQNFRQRHGQGLNETQINPVEKDGMDELKFDLSKPPQMDEKELNCFFDWIQNEVNIFE